MRNVTQDELQAATTAAISDLGNAAALVELSREVSPLERLADPGSLFRRETEMALRLGSTLESASQKIQAVRHAFSPDVKREGKKLVAFSAHEAMLVLGSGVWKILWEHCAAVDPETGEEWFDETEFPREWPAIRKRLAREYGDVDVEVLVRKVILEKDRAIEGLRGEKGAADQCPKHPWGDDDPGTLLSPAKLADRLDIPANDERKREALRKRLESWRTANFDGGWIETRDPRPREPRYLYPISKVWDRIAAMKHYG